MIRKVWNFLCDHGHAVMFAGLAVIVAGALMLVHSRQTGSALESYCWPVVTVGICIYVIGRIGAAFRGRGACKREDDAAL